MTVNTISSIAEFDTNGVTTNFPFFFKFLANEDLVVTYVDPLGVSSTLNLGTHYTVNGAGNDQGGSIVTTSALAGPGQLVVSREMDAFQQTSLRNQGKFLAETHEDVFDKLTMLIQQGFAIFARALKRPFGRDYFFAESRQIKSVQDPTEPQDAATMGWTDRFVSGLLGAIQGPINNALNIFYTAPDLTAHVVQDLSGSNGAALVGRGSGTVEDALNGLSTRIDGLSSEYAKRNALKLASAFYKLKSGQPLVIACQGDSITAGYDITSPDRVPATNGDWATHAPIQYPLALQTILNILRNGSNTVINRGYSGDTAAASYARWTTSPSADVVHLMLGINDAAGSGGATLGQYMQFMELIVRRNIDWGCGVVIHTVTPVVFDSGNYNFPNFTMALRSLAELYGCPIFESETSVQYSTFSSVYSDNTHFNAHGYNKYGNAVGAFILSGGWARRPLMVSGELQLQVGRGSEGVGFFSKGTPLITTPSGSFLTNRAMGRLTNVGDRVTYSFFMDAEVMDVYGVGILAPTHVDMSYIAGPQYAGDVRGAASVNKLTVRSQRARGVVETLGYDFPAGRVNASGNMTLLGTYVGRGWKTLSVFAISTGAFFQGVVLREKSIFDIGHEFIESGQTGVISGATTEAMVYQIPYPLGPVDTTTAPPSAQLPAFVNIPCPVGLLPFKSLGGSYFDSIPIELTISSLNGFVKVLLRRSSGGYGLSVAKIAGDAGGDALIPTAAAFEIRYYDETADAATGGFSAGLATGSQSQYLKLSFGTTPSSFYTITVHSFNKGGGYAA